MTLFLPPCSKILTAAWDGGTQIGQTKQAEKPGGILDQPTIAGRAVTEQVFDGVEWMPHFGANLDWPFSSVSARIFAKSLRLRLFSLN